MRRKKALHFVLLALLLLLLCSCKTQKESDNHLWVVTEASCSDGMNLQAEMIAERMEKENPGLTVRLDILPTDPQEREITLKQLRTKIMSGNGPDVYLLPTGDTLTLDYVQRKTRRTREVQIVPLFADVNQAMRSGIFADICESYNGDRGLGKESLKTEIMDAGMVDGKRYVLPLRFNIPVILTDETMLKSYSIDTDTLNSDTYTSVQTFLSRDAGIAAFFRLPLDGSLLPPPFDYEKEAVLLREEQLVEYLHTYQKWFAVYAPESQSIIHQREETDTNIVSQYLHNLNITNVSAQEFYTINYNIDSFNRMQYYLDFETHWHSIGLPLYTCGLEDTPVSIAISKQEGYSLTMLPLRGLDGSVSASVTYWGAVGSGSQEPELACAFLRQFLTEEFQWDIYRPRTKRVASVPPGVEVQVNGQVENSWPVRAVGSAAHLWGNIQYQNSQPADYCRDNGTVLQRHFQAMELTDADIPALSWDIDEVRFPVTISGTDSLEYALSQLNEPDGTPTDADIDALAQQVCQGLWWHLAEG